MTWLIVCRAIQGIGGGGIFQMVNIIIGDIVPLEKLVYCGSLIVFATEGVPALPRKARSTQPGLRCAQGCGLSGAGGATKWMSSR